ncbi:PDZ domain-containing protein [Paenibacillus hemerocallicola]|uniref:PDZ domain-containing protein n=1 Tax=Paenibacillus hemerocallicola TaxID=1172614 RepID=A0A5C4T2X3_9BACL|nr:PDZ domain-containing protein [Paenibacillus hemerocallicola]TNJ63411.1 PDZ domain-containing protein [Paenibacillus hemerocallicola]
MDVAVELARKVLHALLQLAAQPFYYVGIVFVVLQYRRQIVLERQLFSTRLHSLLDTAWKTVLWGIVAGMAASLVMAFIGATVPLGVVVWLWVLSALLAIVRVRFICLAYSVGLLGVLHFIVMAFPALADVDYVGRAIAPLQELPISSMLALVGLLHLLEAFFVGKQGADMAMPVFVEGKRGKVIGGYQLQQFWPVPLLLLVPIQAGSSSAGLPWTPLFGGDIWSAGWTFAAMPVMLGFAEMTTTRLPQVKAKRSARLLLVYAIAVMGLAAGAEWLPGFALIGSIAAMVLHEALFLWSRREETANPPFYVHDDQGLKILGILPGSPAKEMGLLAGEIIHKANGIKVRTKEELHEALRTNGAFCKLEVINTEGHSKFVKRALFAGEHHLLGVILSPDDKAMYVLEQRNINWFTQAERRKSATASGSDTGRTM